MAIVVVLAVVIIVAVATVIRITMIAMARVRRRIAALNVLRIMATRRRERSMSICMSGDEVEEGDRSYAGVVGGPVIRSFCAHARDGEMRIVTMMMTMSARM
jgi:hypothetical protein